jgi:hypothetical protein
VEPRTIDHRADVEVVHGNQEVSSLPLALWEGSCDVDGDPFERCSDVILVHQVPAAGSGTLFHCTDVTQLVPSLDVAP